jgi:Fe-S cluster assembly protein SufD
VGDTTSQVLWRSVAADNSKSIFTGLLSIAPGAARSQAFEEARSMLLSRQAVAQTIPELEILNHDVKCSHGASVAPIDPEAMFYLESRGLSKPEAKTMLVEGFVEPVLAELPIAGLADEVRTRLRAALGASPSLFDHS